MRITEIRPSFGAVITDVDVSTPFGAVMTAQIEAAFNKYGMLLFRGQTLSKKQLANFGRLFGELQNHVLSQWLDDDVPEVLLVTNKETVGEGKPVYSELGARVWHSDGSISKRSGIATALYGVEVTPDGGLTEIADTAAAYEALTPDMKDKIGDLKAIHDLSYNFEHIGKTLTEEQRKGRQLSDQQREKSPPVEQPVVRTHPITGRRAIYVSLAHTSHIVGMPIDEGRSMIQDLVKHATRPEFVYSHAWTVGDLLVWDNRTTLHRGTPYPAGHRRMLWRTTSVGEPAI